MLHSDPFLSELTLMYAFRMLLAGVACVIVTEIYSAIMELEFQNSDNRVGKGFAILGIYIFIVCYCKFAVCVPHA